jgi:hypothetical protein
MRQHHISARIVAELSSLIIALFFIASAGGPDSLRNGLDSYSGKCLTPLFVDLKIHPSHTIRLEHVMVGGRPMLETSIVSPSGKFRVHFDTSAASSNVPAMVDQNGNRIANSVKQFVDTVAAIFDSVWNTEINQFAFPAPPSDNGADGGNEFDVYIQDLGANSFGYTDWDDNTAINPLASNPRYPTWIVIDNDFGTGFRTKGIPAIEVTAAHEFFHAIQVGSAGVWFNDFQYYEMTAESMESRVFPAVKDYIFDIGDYFKYIETSPLYLSYSNQTPGYERAIWGIYLMKRYGTQIMRTWWNTISSMQPWFALEQTISWNGSAIGEEFKQFSFWNFKTGIHADTVNYYPDGKLFPPLHIEDSESVAGGSYTFAGASQSYVSHYFLATVNSDSTYFIVSNANTEDARSSSHSTFGFSLTASQQGNGITYSFSVSDSWNWKVTALPQGEVEIVSTEKPFPNPFYPAKNDKMYFPVGNDSLSVSSIFILTSSYSLVNEIQSPVEIRAGKRCISWDGRDSKGRHVASGIYLYIISDKTGERKGKFAVLQ